MFLSRKSPPLLPPPREARIGSRYPETGHITDAAELAAYIITKAREEFELPMFAELYYDGFAEWNIDFNVPLPSYARESEALAFASSLVNWVDEFGWRSGSGRSRFRFSVPLREPWEVATYDFPWGTAKVYRNGPWSCFHALWAFLRNRLAASKLAKWFVIL